MKKCLCCNKKKLFLKLTQGLCPECFEEYLECEEEYKNLIRKSSIPVKDAKGIITSIKTLYKKLEKFDHADTSIKSYNCNDLLKVVYQINDINLNLTLNKISTDNDIPKAVKSKVISPISSKGKEDSKTDILQKAFAAPKSTPAKIDVKKNDEAKTNSEIEPIKQSINPELYTKAQEIISKVNNADNDIDEKAYYTFLLNDIYNKSLKKCNITAVDDIQVPDFINSELNKISTMLNIDKKDLYSYYNYAAFSLQTTGIKANKNDILEIAAVKIKFGQIQDTFKTFVNSGKSLSIAMQEKTGISNEVISKSPDIENCLKNFKNFIGDLKLISHNNNLYSGFLNYYYKKFFNEELNNPSECTIKLFRKRFTRYYGEPPERFNLDYCMNELLQGKVINDIRHEKSTALQNAMGTFHLYEIIKKGYK